MRQGGTDENILEWCCERGRRPDLEEIEIWKDFLTRRGWRDGGNAQLAEAKRAWGFATAPKFRPGSTSTGRMKNDDMVIPNIALKMTLPMACAWAEKQEAIILRDGVALTGPLLADARRIGVVNPDRVRLLVVEEMPWPLHPFLRQAAEATGVLSRDTIGLTLRYGIFIRADRWGDRRLVVHELAHTAQYERLGGFRPFLDQYLCECNTPPGYPFGALEQEAKRIEQELCCS